MGFGEFLPAPAIPDLSLRRALPAQVGKRGSQAVTLCDLTLSRKCAASPRTSTTLARRGVSRLSGTPP